MNTQCGMFDVDIGGRIDVSVRKLSVTVCDIERILQLLVSTKVFLQRLGNLKLLAVQNQSERSNVVDPKKI